MKWKEFVKRDLECEECPLKKEEICPGGAANYGNGPIEPPCTCFDDEDDLDEWVKEYFAYQEKREKAEEERIKREKAKKEKAKRAAETRRQMRLYCREEINTIKRLEKQKKSFENAYDLAQSMAFAFNTTNEMFGYTERVKEKPEIQKTIDELELKIVEAKEKYDAKRKEFYAKRKQEER